MTPTDRSPEPISDAAIGALVAFAAIVGVVWAGAALAATVTGVSTPPVTDAAAALIALPGHFDEPASAWPTLQEGPGPVLYWVAQAAVLASALAVAAAIANHRSRPKGRRSTLGPRAGLGVGRGRDLRALAVDGPKPGRVTLGRSGSRLIATEPGASALVVGPTGCGKTAGFAIPLLREWDGPVLATSVKTDLLDQTITARRRAGRVFVYDPADITAFDDGWTPLDACSSWAGAQRVAAWLCEAAQPTTTTLADGDYWYAQARRALAPYLHAAALAERPIGTVVAWIESEPAEAIRILHDAGTEHPLRSLHALWNKEERLRSSILSTAETVVAGYADPHVAALAAAPTIDLCDWLSGPNTLYVVSPAHDQTRLRPVLAVLLAEAIRTAFDLANANNGRLPHPLLALLDEAGTMAPLNELPTWAATARSHAISLVTVWQDLAQITSRYGPLASTVVNNHRAKLFGSGIADPDTLDMVAALIGDERHRDHTTSRSDGKITVNETATWQRAAPPDALRRLAPHEALLIYGHHLPARIRLRPHFARAQR